MKVLAVTEEKRNPALPDVPTVAEAGLAKYAMTTWYGLVAPNGIPRDIGARLNAEINRILKLSDVRERFATLGGVVLHTPAPGPREAGGQERLL